MTEPQPPIRSDRLYTGVAALPDATRTAWVSLGATSGGMSYSGDLAPDGTITETVRNHATGETTVTTTGPDGPEWTIGDALDFLDPKPKRRTVSRWLKDMTPTGERSLPQGGPPARTYPAAEIIRRHAKWAHSYGRLDE